MGAPSSCFFPEKISFHSLVCLAFMAVACQKEEKPGALPRQAVPALASATTAAPVAPTAVARLISLGTVLDVRGSVRVRRAVSGTFLYVKEGFPLRLGDRIVTESNASVTLSYAFEDSPVVVTLPELSHFTLERRIPLPALGPGRFLRTDTQEVLKGGQITENRLEGAYIQPGGLDAPNSPTVAGRPEPGRLALLFQAREIAVPLPKRELLLSLNSFPLRHVVHLNTPLRLSSRLFIHKDGSREELPSQTFLAGVEQISFSIDSPGSYKVQLVSVDGFSRSRPFRIRAVHSSGGEREAVRLLPGSRFLVP